MSNTAILFQRAHSWFTFDINWFIIFNISNLVRQAGKIHEAARQHGRSIRIAFGMRLAGEKEAYPVIWDEKVELMPRGEMRALQFSRLKRAVNRAYSDSELYRAKFDAVGLKPRHIRSMDDLRLIPFTVKDDLRRTYPFGMFQAPMKKVVRLHASTGTTGKPTVVGYTKKDLDMWADSMARLICMAGVTEDDVAQIAFGYGMFTGALGLHYGLEKVGCAVIPASAGNTERQLMFMRDFGTTVLVGTPSYAMYIAETAERLGIDVQKDLKLRVGLFGGEGHSEKMRGEIEKKLHILATENYGLSEIIGPGVSGECVEKHGMHVNEDHFIPEIIDPGTGETLPAGEKGELVITAVTKEALPILRYRTRDITWLTEEPCKCGRTLIRMAKVQGRSDDMLIIRGVNVFPSQIEEVLHGVPEVGPNYEIIVKRENYMDNMEILVELIDASLLDRYSELESLTERIRSRLHAMLLLDARVRLVEPLTLKRFEGKAKRVTDLRNQ
jgi:phenylacetate-CoA ligase